ncbi:hypothetical protein [Bacillus nitroreducens]
MKNGFIKKGVVLEDLDQLLLKLNEIDTQIQTEVNNRILEEGNRNIGNLKSLENDLASLRNSYHSQAPEQVSHIKREHSYHLTLSY